MKKPVVMQVIEFLLSGGAGVVVATIAEGLKERGVEPVICALKQGPAQYSLVDSLREKGIRVRVLSRSGRNNPLLLVRLARLMRRERVDVVQTHLFGGNFWGRVAARMAGVPAVVGTEHNLSDARLEPRYYFPIDRALAPATDRVVAVCERVAESVISRKRIPRGKVVVIHNGVDLRRFSVTHDRDRVRRELKIEPDAPVVGFVGRFSEEKNLPALLRALAGVRAVRPEAVCVLVGEGPLLGDLHHQSEALGVVSGLRFTGFRRDVERILQALDVFVLPSWTEGLSITLLEAMAAGKPAVVTDVGGSSEAVLDGVTGLVIPPGDHLRLAEALLMLLGDKAMQREMGQAARKRSGEEFSREMQVEGLLRMYREVLAEKGRSWGG